MNTITMSECSKRKLDDTYLVVYAIKNVINIKKVDYIEQCDIYTFIGVNTKGYRHILNIYQERLNNNHYWLDCFEALKARGIKNILFLSVDNNKNMKRTAKIAFPSVMFVDSITDIVPRFYKYSTDRSNNRVSGKLHNLYVQKTLTDFHNVFNTFKSEYNNIIHQKLIVKYLGNIESIYKYSINIRKLLFKHTANINLYDKIRLTFDNNKSYINDINEIYEKLGNSNEFFDFTSFSKKDWNLIVNDLINLFPDIDFI